MYNYNFCLSCMLQEKTCRKIQIITNNKLFKKIRRMEHSYKKRTTVKKHHFFSLLSKAENNELPEGVNFFSFFFFCLAKPSIRSYQEGLTFFIFPFGDFLLSFDIFETKQKLRFTYNKSILGIRTYYAFPKKNHIEH